MALFQKKTVISSAAPLYTLGLQKNILLVGLGNVGQEYDGTRHNIGFACIDSFVEKTDLGAWVEKKDLSSQQASGMLGDTRVIAIKPTTLMNNSGLAVARAAHFYKIPLESIVVVHDELAIPFGQIRTRLGGSDAGNNGIKSVIKHIGEDFGRVRIGIKSETRLKQTDFVLARFSSSEQEQLPNLYKETISILTEYVYSGSLPIDTRNFLV
jgi:peptidyl-tRNA hydrolase, PTH1 family